MSKTGIFLTKEKALEATNGGLDIITDYFPDAQDVVDKRKTHFKMHEERTASATIKDFDGVWKCTDFGEDSKAKDCFSIVKEKEGLDDFKEVLRFISEKYRIAPDGSIKAAKAEFEKREATADEVEGTYDFIIRKEVTDAEFREVFPRYHPDQREKYEKVFTNYMISAVEQFTYIKNRKALITKATDSYPIYIIEGEGFKKIYQPRAEDKNYRFRYVGKKPHNYVFGLKQLREAYNRINEEAQAAKASLPEDDLGEGKTVVSEKKLPEVIIASGDRDALNVAGLGYAVIWLNSETADLSEKIIRDLNKYSEKLYNLPDIDDTGVRKGKKLLYDT